jgi:outer membrane protein W
MKKRFLLTAGAVMLFAFLVNGQIQVGAGLGLQMPVGDFSDGYNPGIGLHVAGKYLLNEKMAVGLNLGYAKFGSEYEHLSCSMVPVTGLFEYYLGKKGKVTPYVGADLGLYNLGVKYKYEGTKTSDSELYFGLAPVAGILYELNDLISLTGNLKYNVVFADDESLSYIGINVGIAYKLNLKK